MASMTTNKLRQLLLNTGINLLTDTIKVMLVQTSYTPDKDHDFVSSITGGTTKEIAGTGYTGGFGGGGRKTLASKTVAKDDTGDVAFFDAADSAWTGLDAGTVGFAVLIKEVTSDADSPIIAIVDVSPDIVTNTGDYTIQWAATGIFNIA